MRKILFAFVFMLALNTAHAQLTLTYALSDTVSCDSTCAIDVDVTVSFASLPVQFAWSNGATTEDLTDVCPGSYTVAVTDADSVTTFFEVIATQYSAVTINPNVVHATCGLPNGSISLTINGTPPYQIFWNNGTTDASLDSIFGNDYGVTVTDATGCSAQQIVTVLTTPPVYFTTSQTPACDSANASININVQHGTPPYTYLLNNAPASASTSSLDSGLYVAVVTDLVGCSMTDTVNVLRGSAPTACFEATSSPCSCGVPYTLDFASCTQPSTLQHDWIFAGGDIQPPFNMPHQTVVYNTPGTFLVGLTVTDSAGCSDDLWLFDYVQINDDTVFILNPVSVLEVTQSYTFICTGSVNYDWSVNPSNGTFTTGDSTSTYTVFFGNTGNYEVCVKSVYPNACGACEVESCTLLTVKDSVDGVHQVVADLFETEITPNPTSGITTISFSHPATKNLLLNIYDATGRAAQQIEIPVNALSVSFDASEMPRGLYIYRVETVDKEMLAQGKLALH